MLTEEPYLGLTSIRFFRDIEVLGLPRIMRQVLHGCRQLVP